MKKINIAAVIFLILALGAFIRSVPYRTQVKEAGKDIPKLTGRVVDMADALTPEEEVRVTQEIITLEKKTGGQMAILTIFSTGTTPIEEYSMKVAESWKIGHKGNDNGAILILAIKDRRNRLEIGRGWEGPINDARAGDILRHMANFLRKGFYEEALTLAVRAVTGFVTGGGADLPQLEKNTIGKDITTPDDHAFRWTTLATLLLMISIGCTRPGRHIYAFLVLNLIGLGGGSSGGSSSGGGGGSDDDYSGDGGSFSGGGASGSW